MTRRNPPRRLGLAFAFASALAACGGSGAAGSTTASAPVAAPTVAAPPAKSEPTTGEAVIEASLVALGGRDKLAKITSIKQTGTLSIQAIGAKGTITILAAPPRNELTTIELPGLGKLSQGVHDDVAWELTSMTGARIVTGAERVLALREATFQAELNWKEIYPKAELTGVVDFAGTQAYKVVLTAKEGDTQTRFFAKDTFLPIGVEMTVDSQMGKIPVTVQIFDYREVGGIKYAHKITRKEGQQAIEIVIDTFEPNLAIPPSAFDLPAEIKALKK